MTSRRSEPADGIGWAVGVASQPVRCGSQESTRVFQAGLLAQVLEATGWNISETARRLDLTRTHVRHLIASFGLRS
jgi:transcriptional regulator with GAF, ATPase, and Fis domain